MIDATTKQHEAQKAFFSFFAELREWFLERDMLFTQIELALLCREHVLVSGPPGTAKSAIASAVLARILDEQTGKPSLFTKQLSESTVQTDLIGPVDFKVLTETGRTEYLTDDGMLGATHAFLDEVFDGRDMLLRSILNVLHERELKHGRRVTAGRIECALMTSNRYLSEVLARSPELLLAFADRLSFICFVPKSFAQRTSRALMLTRTSGTQRPDLRARLSLQQLDLLQEMVEKVVVPAPVLEGVELLSEALERELLAHVSKLPDYVPTKYFSNRSIVKALWALKAAVVRDVIYRHPDRPLEATPDDLDALRAFFLLGGPSGAETDAILKSVVDPRERAQLEILKLEHRTFDDVLAKVKGDLSGGREREAQALPAGDDAAGAEAVSRAFQASLASQTARSLLSKLKPGPRYPENRRPLLNAATVLVDALDARLSRGMAGQGEGRGGIQLLRAFGDVLELCHGVPELQRRLPSLCQDAARFCEQAVEMVCLAAEGAAFESNQKLETLAALAAALEGELSQLGELTLFLGQYAQDACAKVISREKAARGRIAGALRKTAIASFVDSRAKLEREDAPVELLAVEARRLRQLEAALVRLDPFQAGLRQELLGPIGIIYARRMIAQSAFDRIDGMRRVIASLSETLRQEGVEPAGVIAETRDVLEKRLGEHAKLLSVERKAPPIAPAQASSGDAYQGYREWSANSAREGELAALLALDGMLTGQRAVAQPTYLADSLRQSIASAELLSLHSRATYLREWLTHLLAALPPPESLVKKPEEVSRVFDKLVKSRFPLLAMKEGELVRLASQAEFLSAQPGVYGEQAQTLRHVITGISEDFGEYSRRLLALKSARVNRAP